MSVDLAASRRHPAGPVAAPPPGVVPGLPSAGFTLSQYVVSSGRYTGWIARRSDSAKLSASDHETASIGPRRVAGTGNAVTNFLV